MIRLSADAVVLVPWKQTRWHKSEILFLDEEGSSKRRESTARNHGSGGLVADRAHTGIERHAGDNELAIGRTTAVTSWAPRRKQREFAETVEPQPKILFKISIG